MEIETLDEAYRKCPKGEIRVSIVKMPEGLSIALTQVRKDGSERNSCGYTVSVARSVAQKLMAHADALEKIQNVIKE